MPSIPASGPPERRGEGRRPVGPSAFASVRLPRSRHRFVPAPASYLRRSRLCAEPYARRRLPRSFLARRRPGWGEKAVAALRPFEIDRSLRREASPLGRHLLRSGTAPFRHRFSSAPASFLAGAFASRSLHFAEPLLRGASARSFHGVSPPPTPASFGHRLVPPRSPLYAGAVSGCACNQVDIFEPGSDYKLLTGSPPAPCRAPVSPTRTLSS